MDLPAIQDAVTKMLAAFGENPARKGLERTPERVASMYTELLAGYRVDPYKIVNDALFDVSYDEIVIVRDIEFYSLCEHHMLPFMGRAHVAYLPSGRVIGLSKIPRIVDVFAHRLQVQERMTRQIADFINDALAPKGVAVVVEAFEKRPGPTEKPPRPASCPGPCRPAGPGISSAAARHTSLC